MISMKGYHQQISLKEPIGGFVITSSLLPNILDHLSSITQIHVQLICHYKHQIKIKEIPHTIEYV